MEAVRPVPLAEDAENHLLNGSAAPNAVPTFDPIARPADADRGRILWPYVLGFGAFHLLLPLAFVPWLFSWTGLVLVPLGNYLFCSLGIGAGFHRLLTHRSFRCPRWVEHTFAVLGVCSLQDSPARWVMIHRLHHQHSDRQPDPHSPLVSWFWGHMGWLLVENRALSRLAPCERYARDMLPDPCYPTSARAAAPREVGGDYGPVPLPVGEVGGNGSRLLMWSRVTIAKSSKANGRSAAGWPTIMVVRPTIASSGWRTSQARPLQRW